MLHLIEKTSHELSIDVKTFLLRTVLGLDHRIYENFYCREQCFLIDL